MVQLYHRKIELDVLTIDIILLIVLYWLVMKLEYLLNCENTVTNFSNSIYGCCRLIIFQRSKIELRTRTCVTGYVECILKKDFVILFLSDRVITASCARWFSMKHTGKTKIDGRYCRVSVGACVNMHPYVHYPTKHVLLCSFIGQVF